MSKENIPMRDSDIKAAILALARHKQNVPLGPFFVIGAELSGRYYRVHNLIKLEHCMVCAGRMIKNERFYRCTYNRFCRRDS